MGLRRTALVVVVAATTVLAGCTGSGGRDDETSGAGGSGSVRTPPPTTGAVLVEQEIGAPADRGNESPGGTMLVTVRSVTASEGATVVSWAVRWDNPEAADDAAMQMDEFFGLGDPPVLTDGAALKLLYPLCPDSDWHEIPTSCRYSALYSPHPLFSEYTMTNHQPFEAWAVFPGLDENTTTVDLALPGGLPAFAALPVTRQ